MMNVLVTGGLGCLGAWVTRHLVDLGAAVTVFDIGTDDRRLRRLLSDNELGGVRMMRGDLTDAEQVRVAVAGSTHVVHLGALQVPFCRADPARGAAVNVTGTVNVFEAVKAHGVRYVAFASSAAVYGPPEQYDEVILPADAPRRPATLYGVYKVANEDVARLYWRDDGVPSIGLRPHSVYGTGRDQGLTSQPSVAIEAAARHQPYHIDFGGTLDLQYASDVARIFVAAVQAAPVGGETYSIRGDVVTMEQFVWVLREATGAPGITHGTQQLPVPHGLDDGPLRQRLGDVPHTPLAEGIAATAERAAQPT